MSRKSINISDEKLWRDFRSLCLKRGYTVSSAVEKMIKDEVKIQKWGF